MEHPLFGFKTAEKTLFGNRSKTSPDFKQTEKQTKQEWVAKLWQKGGTGENTPFAKQCRLKEC